jgi:site-specific DNA recombinase
VDDAVSGATYARLDGRKRMIAAAEARLLGDHESLKGPRLGRDMIEVAYTIKQIAEHGVRIFVYLDDSEISVEDEVAQAMTMLRGFSAASERRQTSKRVFDSALRRVKAGQVAGAKVFGYDNIPVLGPSGKKSHVERRKNDAQAAIVVRVFELYASGLGSVKVARRLNAEGVISPRHGWSQTTVRGVLRNPIYRGEVVWGRIKTICARGRTTTRRVPSWSGSAMSGPSYALCPRISGARSRRAASPTVVRFRGPGPANCSAARLGTMATANIS